MTTSETNKLYKSIATDFKIITRKTGLWSLEYCEKILHDIKVLMLNDYLLKISIILEKPKDIPIKVKQFLIGASDRKNNDRPGDNEWEENDGEKLNVVLSYTGLWHALPNEEKNLFIKNNIKIGWVSASVDTNFSNLQKKTTKQYSTGMNGADRTDFY
jgi:hypothetical protein